MFREFNRRQNDPTGFCIYEHECDLLAMGKTAGTRWVDTASNDQSKHVWRKERPYVHLQVLVIPHVQQLLDSRFTSG